MDTPLRVLMVEADEKDALRTLRELRSAGYEPISKCVATLEAFLAVLEQDNWDVVLADYSIPGFNSPDALKAKRELIPDVPFVVVSAATEEETIVAAIKAGADDYVLKRNFSRLGPVIDRSLHDAAVRRVRKQDERTLQDRDDLFRSVIENVPNVLIVILDEDGSIRYCSPSVDRTLGYERDELTGKSVLDYLHPDARSVLTRPERDFPDIPLITCEIRHKDGSWRTLEGTVTNLLADPIVAGIVCNIHDVTQHREVQKQLSRSLRMASIGNLAAGIAHDLNNILTPIMVAAELLQDGLPQADRKTLLQGLVTGAKRATDVVQQLLSFAKGMRADREVARVVELIRETEQLLRFGFPKSICVHANLPDSVWPVLIGATEFTQVLMNLCVNARDAMPEGGRLSLSAANVTVGPQDAGMYPGVTPGQYVVLDIADTGVGISPELQKRIFDLYFTTKESTGGTGLGLSAICRILRDHGGFIKTYSEVGQGTRFAVYLPALTTPGAATSVPSPRSWPMGQGELVLVIDDQGAIREILRETLETHNYRVVTAADGVIGLSLYRERFADFDLVIVDLTGPVMDAQATIAAIRSLNPSARIILQSGFVSERSKSQSNSQLADAFLERPYAADELLHSVHELLQPR